jgi:hypothetical protein
VSAKSLNADPVAFWLKLVKRYSKLQLSHTTDKLVAMAGIAKLFYHSDIGEYLGGLWRVNLEL